MAMAAQRLRNVRHRVLLIGPSGAGKSSLGNLLLEDDGGETFKVSEAWSSCTRAAKTEVHRGDNLAVTDTIGLGDTAVPEDQVGQVLRQTLQELGDQGGPTQVFVVMKHGRQDGMACAVLDFVLKFVLGREVTLHLFLVFTRSGRLSRVEAAEKRKWLEREAHENVHVSALYKYIDRNPERVLFVENPPLDDADDDDGERHNRKQRARARETLMEVIRPWSLGGYVPQSLQALEEAYQRHQQEQNARELELQQLREAVRQCSDAAEQQRLQMQTQAVEMENVRAERDATTERARLQDELTGKTATMVEELQRQTSQLQQQNAQLQQQIANMPRPRCAVQ